MPDTVDTVKWAPVDGWRYHPKHVEQFADIYKLYIVASCWIIIDSWKLIIFFFFITANNYLLLLEIRWRTCLSIDRSIYRSTFIIAPPPSLISLQPLAQRELPFTTPTICSQNSTLNEDATSQNAYYWSPSMNQLDSPETLTSCISGIDINIIVPSLRCLFA